MNIHSIIGKGYDSNIFVIDGEKPTVIDTGTGMNTAHVISEMNEVIDVETISQIILTHEHFDHVGGVKQLFEASNKQAKILAHTAAAEKIEKGESMFASLLGEKMPKVTITQKLADGEILQIGDSLFNVLSTPGHTPGCICLYDNETQTLFSGDTLFANGSFGRTDLPGGNRKELKASIRRLSTLEISRLYPGHEMVVEDDADKHVRMAVKNVNYFG